MKLKEDLQQGLTSPWLETGVSNLPYSRLVARIIAENAKEAREPLGKLGLLKINIDRRQRAFHDGANPGGLPVDKGAAVDEYAEATERKSDWGGVIDTIDWHDDKNLSLAKNYGFEPFSSLSLQNGVVTYNDRQGSVPYAEKIKGREDTSPPGEVIEEYLRKKQVFRTFLALMFDNQVTGLEQTLWPTHAVNRDDELGYLNQLAKKGELPDMVVFKGGEAQNQLGELSGIAEHDWKPDSYSAIFDATGEIIRTISLDGGKTIIKGNVGHKIRKLIEERRLEGVVLDGIAFTHCVKDTAEGLRLMQKMQELIETGNYQEVLRKKYESRKNEVEFAEVSWEDIAGLCRHYLERDMTLDPKYIIAVNVEKTVPVQLPGPEMEAVNQQIVDSAEQGYRSMGVRLITDEDLI